jgi:hypothetical protein
MLLYLQDGSLEGQSGNGGGSGLEDSTPTPDDSPATNPDGTPIIPTPPAAPAEGAAPQGAREAITDLATTIESMGLTELFESIAGDLVEAIRQLVDILEDAFPGIADSASALVGTGAAGGAAAGGGEVVSDAMQEQINIYAQEINDCTFKSPLILDQATVAILADSGSDARVPLITAIKNSGISHLGLTSTSAMPEIEGITFIRLSLPTETTNEIDPAQKQVITQMINSSDTLMLDNTGEEGLILESTFKLLKNLDLTTSASPIEEAQVRTKLTELGYTDDQIGIIAQQMAFILLIVNDSEIRTAALAKFSPNQAPAAVGLVAPTPVAAPIPAVPPTPSAPSPVVPPIPEVPSIQPEATQIGDELDDNEFREIMSNSDESTQMQNINATLTEDLIIQPNEIIKFGEGSTITANAEMSISGQRAALALGEHFKDSPDPNSTGTTTGLESAGTYGVRMLTDLYFAPSTETTIPAGITISGNISTWRLSSNV